MITELIRTIKFNIGNVTITGNTVLLCGNSNTKIKNYIKHQLDIQNPYLYDYTNKDKTYPLSTYELAGVLEKFLQQIIKRAEYLSMIKSDRNYQLLLNKNEYIRPNVIIIDDFINHIESNDFKSVEMIKTILKEIAKIAKKANTYLFVYSSNDKYTNHIDFDTIINFDTNTFTHIIQEDEIEDNLEDFDDDEDDDEEPVIHLLTNERNLQLELEDSKFINSNTPKEKKDLWIKLYRQAKKSNGLNLIVSSMKQGNFTITNDDKVLILPNIK